MAKLKMRQIEIIAMYEDRKAILEMLQRKEAVELFDVEPADGLRKSNKTRGMAQFEKNVQLCGQALRILEEYAPRKKGLLASLAGRREITLQEFEARLPHAEETIKKCYDIKAQHKGIADKKAMLIRNQSVRDALLPWMTLDVPMQLPGTTSTRAFIGYLPPLLSFQALCEKLTAEYPELEHYVIELVSATREQLCIFALCHQSIAMQMESALRACGFTRPSDPTRHPPQVRMERYENEAARLEQEITAHREAIVQYGNLYDDIEFASDYYAMRRQKYEKIEALAMTKSTFVLRGYIPENRAAEITKVLEDQFAAAVSIADLPDAAEAPVLLKNNRFVTPVEPITEMYGAPSRTDADPNPVMSFFYYLLFGLMLSDAAYGIIMVVVCALVLRLIKPEGNLQKSFKMFFYCGISTIIWGVVFGSWFGDIVNVVSRTFFGHEVSIPPLWFTPLQDPMKMLIFSFGVGILHLFAGLAISFYTKWKLKQRLDAVFDVGSWYLLLLGAVILIAGPMLGFADSIANMLSQIGKYMAIAGAVMVVLFTSRDSKNIFARFGAGLYNLYGISGYLSDILSYSRLLALSLATGVIAQVVNTMGSMGGDSIAGAIILTVVFLLGHTLNIAINLLGSFVHTNRLQYVEFFAKFYEGSGRLFSPLRTHTRYIKLKEDQMHG